MKELTHKELREVQINILVYIDSICKKNNINYAIGCGTLLGAVRRGGFIPWDDDIDIVMIRSEYERFINVMLEKDDEIYKILTPKNKGYFYNYAKVTDSRTLLIEKNWPTYENLGVNVDIFPQDYVPEGDPKKLVDEAWKYDTSLKYCLTDIAYKHDKWYMRLVKKICRQREVKEIRKYDEWYWKGQVDRLIEDTKESAKVACLTSPPMVVWDSKLFEEYTDIVFEGINFRTVKNYQKMLEVQYGDYMKLPPEEKRVSNHDFIPYWK